MAKIFNSTLRLGADSEIQLSNVDSYETFIDTRLEINAQDSGVLLFEITPEGSSSAMPSTTGAKFICLHNEGDQTLEIHLETGQQERLILMQVLPMYMISGYFFQISLLFYHLIRT